MKLFHSKTKDLLAKAGTQYRATGVSFDRAKIWAHFNQRLSANIAQPAENLFSWRHFFQPVFRRLTPISLSLVGTMLLGGTAVYAAGNSLPGDALYPLNRGLETINEHLITNPQQKARYKLQLAGKRIHELTQLKQLHRDIGQLKQQEKESSDDFEKTYLHTQKLINDVQAGYIKRQKPVPAEINAMGIQLETLKSKYDILKISDTDRDQGAENKENSPKK